LRAPRIPIERTGCRAAAAVLAGLMAIGVCLTGWPHAAAQDLKRGVVSREYKIKAAFLYNFGRYVHWPSEAFRDARAPFVIGLAGPSPVAVSLQRIAKTKRIGGRPIEIRRIRDVEALGGQHVVFFPAAVQPETEVKMLRRLSGRPVLLVGEQEGFLDRGGMINLVIEENRVRVDVALKRARQGKLVISSKLLQVARIVD
jgi:hypothetical protein